MQRPLVNLAGLPCLALATAFLLLRVQWVLCWEKSAVGTRNHGSKQIRLGGLAESQSTVAREC